MGDPMTPRIYASPAFAIDETAGAGWRILRRTLLYLMLVAAPWGIIWATILIPLFLLGVPL